MTTIQRDRAMDMYLAFAKDVEEPAKDAYDAAHAAVKAFDDYLEGVGRVRYHDPQWRIREELVAARNTARLNWLGVHKQLMRILRGEEEYNPA